MKKNHKKKKKKLKKVNKRNNKKKWNLMKLWRRLDSWNS